MSDILDEQEPVVQSDDVPNSFRQGMLDEPPPAPEPEPEPTPEPEPEAPPVTPDWLHAEPEPPAQPQPGPEYPPMPPPQLPPNQPPPPPNTQAGLDAFIENPNAYIQELARAEIQNQIGPLAQQLQMVGGMTQQMRESQTRAVSSQAEAGINKAYETFNKDSSFKSNPQLQQRIHGTLKTLYSNALQAAQYSGDYTGLYNLANMGEREFAATLAAAKMYEGITAGASAPLQIEGAVAEEPRAAAKEMEVPLTAEEEEIARRVGGNYADRLRKAKAESAKYNDFEMS